MNITRFAIENNRLSLVVLVAVIATGLKTFFDMPRAYDPGFIIRAAQVVTYFPGASPGRVEKLISSKIEDAVKEMPELDYVKSESRTGVSIVTVNIKESFTEMRPIWDKLRRKVDDARGDLPSGISGPFVNDEFGDVFGIVVAVTGEGFSPAELNDVVEEVRDELQRLPDAAKVETYGAQAERVFVEYDNARLAELGISPYQLSQSLASRNIVSSGGSINIGNERLPLEPSGNLESVADIEQTIIRLPGTDRILYLKDIGKVSRGYADPPEALVHVNGQPAMAVAIAMREGGNNIELGKQVVRRLAELEDDFPWGIEFELINFSPREVDEKVRNFVLSLVQALAVVSVVILLALGLRTGIIVSMLIPTAMLMALIVMSFFDIGLDQVSLAALIIALGMLVDNGIVVSENILVEIQKGKSAMSAAIDSVAELRLPLLTASVTTAAAFLPIYLAESDVGEFTASLFKVVSITLLCSWLIAVTIVPMLCVYFLKRKQGPESNRGGFSILYKTALGFCLRQKILSLLIVLLLFVTALMGFSNIPKLFFPASDRLYFKIEFELPAGTSIARTQTVVSALEQFMDTNLRAGEQYQHGVTNWVSYIGNAGPRFVLSHNPKPASDSYAFMVVNVDDENSIAGLMARLRMWADESYPDLELRLRRIESGPAVVNPVEVRLSSDDQQLLFERADALKKEMERIGGLINITDDWGQRIKKLMVRVDQPRALRAGLTSQDIAVSLQAGLSGMELTEYRDGEDLIPVHLRSTAVNYNDIAKLESLSVYAQTSGTSVPLRQVADIEVVWDSSKIYRRDGVKTITIGAQLLPGITAAEKFSELGPWFDDASRQWSQGTRFELGGENESSRKANQSIVDKLPFAVFIILIVLVGQFNSIRKALIVLTTVPLGLIGVSFGLQLADSFMGFMTFLGIISLSGIVINNAIVLLEKIQLEIDAGAQASDAIVDAALQRARPILLTTATTVLGLIPLYLGGGEMWEPMAISIMAGLLFSTVLTLIVVPVLYASAYRVKF